VTWLELFSDLIFVAAVSQVAEPLRAQYSLAGLLRFAPLFALIWWAWTGNTVFATRFDTDDLVQRGLTFLQMFAVAIMAANAKDALDSRSSGGFAAAYAVVRLVLLAQYLRARRLPEARSLTSRYLTGHGMAAVVWLASAIAPAPERFWLWAIAFAIDLGTPWFAVRHTVSVPPDAQHLPERYGLFMLILLGESVIAVMQGIESHEDWTLAAATSAFLGMGVSFLIWWWYFDGALGASEQPVRTRRDAFRFHVWSYAHLPLAFGIVVVGVGVQRIVTAASHAAITADESHILIGAVVLAMLAITTVGLTSAGRRHRASDVPAHLILSAVTVAIASAIPYGSPLALIVAIAAVCFAQLAVSLKLAPPAHRQPHLIHS
jgi:low temperature requirement protein LtrA